MYFLRILKHSLFGRGASLNVTDDRGFSKPVCGEHTVLQLEAVPLLVGLQDHLVRFRVTDMIIRKQR